MRRQSMLQAAGGSSECALRGCCNPPVQAQLVCLAAALKASRCHGHRPTSLRPQAAAWTFGHSPVAATPFFQHCASLALVQDTCSNYVCNSSVDFPKANAATITCASFACLSVECCDAVIQTRCIPWQTPPLESWLRQACATPASPYQILAGGSSLLLLPCVLLQPAPLGVATVLAARKSERMSAVHVHPLITPRQHCWLCTA